MSKQTEKTLVPKLRFPEFQDAGGWDIKELGKVAALITEKAGVKRYTLMSVTAGIGLVTQIEKFGKEIAGEAYKNYYVIRKGDFAYNKSSTKQHPEGQMAFLESVDQGAVPNSIFTCFRVDEKFVSPYFLKYPFATNIHGKWLRNFIAVGARANGALNVDSKDLLALPIVFPSLKEQQTIADCLSSIDKLISAQSQKTEDLKTHKKGLMQQLFTREGETVPRLRFPEFQNAEEWESVRLIDVADKKIKWSFIGGPFGSNLKSSDYVSEGVRIIQLQNIGDAEFFDDYKIFTTKEKADELLANNIYPGEIILSKMGDPVGRACLIPNKHARYIMCSDGIRLVVDEKIYSKYFIYTLLNSLKFRALVEKTAIGSTRKRIGLDDLKNLPIIVPTKGEQKKIANCLSSIDELIRAHTQKLEALKIHKKGLMQQLFPNTEAEKE